MNASPDRFRDLDDLLAAVCDQTAGPDDIRRIEALADDDEGIERVLDYLHLDGLLRWENGSGIDAPEADFDAFPAFEAIPATHFQHYMPLTTGLISYAAALLILCMALLGAWAWQINHYQPIAVRQSPPVDRPDVQIVARITGVKDCRCAADQTQPYVGSTATLGRVYTLESGLLEITYNTGAKVILEGPCTYKVDSPAGGYLESGKLTANISGQKSKVRGRRSEDPIPIPHPSSLIPHLSSLIPHLSSFTPHPSSFVVKTPTVSVTDLGTEFGVEVDKKGETTSHVFQGSVLVRAITKKQSVAPTGSVDIEIVDLNVMLMEGQSVRVQRGNDDEKMQLLVDPVGWDPSSFVRVMPKPDPAGVGKTYADLILSLHPAVYYRMDQPGENQSDNMVSDSVPGGRHGELRLGNEYGGRPYRPGRFGDSLWLRGPEVGDYAFVADYPKAENDRLTVSAWVMATGRPGWAMIASNWATPKEGRDETDNAGQFHFGLYRQDGDLCARIMQRNGKRVQLREGTPLPVGVWQHVALTVDGEYARLYRNGKEVNAVKCDGLLSMPPVDALCIGCSLDVSGKEAEKNTYGYRYWQGRIDELAIFNEALSAERIKLLAAEKKGRDSNSITVKEKR